MADSKITALTALTAADPINDMLPIVDVSDTTMAASGTTKKISVNNILSSSPTASGALTVTGLVTAGSATITGAATVGTTLGVTGDLTASSDVLVNGNEKYVYLSSTYSIGSNPRVRFRAVGAGGGSGYGGDFRISTRASNNNWNTDALTVDSFANVNVALGNVVMGTSGKGIDFSAVTGGTGTATANVLNDYEEGTWTIGLTFGGGNTGLTTVLNTGRYTKIGRQVTVCGRLELSSKGSSTGAAVITGLPFAVGNGNDSQQAASFRFNGVSYVGAFQGYGGTAGTNINLEQISEAGSLTDITNSNFTNSTSIHISLTYTV